VYVLADVPSGRRRWSGLDGLRAIAVAAVVVFHFAPGVLHGGFLGVDIFFVLSGYLITRMIAAEFLRFGSFRFRYFYFRRARRLLPGLAVVLISVLAAAAFWRDQLTTVRSATAAAVGYVSNWWLSYAHQSYFVTAGRPSMLQHLWSLGVEEQFYLFWPLIAIGVCTVTPARWRARVLAGVALLLALASAAEMTLLAVAENAPVGADASRLYYGTDTHSMGLLLGAAFGALAAGSAVSRAPARRRLLWLTDGLAAGALVTIAVVIATTREDSSRLYRGGFLVVAAVTAIAVAALARDGSRLGVLLDRRPLRWLAARSYAIYLWHWPIAVITRPGTDLHWPSAAVFGFRLAVTLLLADVTYRAIERPVRTLGLRDSLRGGVRRTARVIVGQAPVGARLATAALVMTLLVAGGVLATGPRPTLSAGQRALAGAHGGRDLPLGPDRPDPPLPTPIGSISNVAAQSTTPTRQPDPRPSITHRVPSHRRTPTPPPPLTISAYGDSVMLGARLSLDQRFPGGMLDAIEGRQPGPILHDVEQDEAAGKLNRLVVIGVGDNGLINSSDLWSALATLRRVPHVVVVNNRVGRPWEGPNNRTIAQVIPHFRNVTLLDWHTASAGHGSWFYDDGIHLTPVGALNYTRLIALAARRR
jgi:peptidoglycan/LPS O-acetylase OafA/YrhL